MITIEEKLRAILKLKGWRQQHLAERLGVTQATVSRWFSGSEPEGHRRDAINELYDSTALGEVTLAQIRAANALLGLESVELDRAELERCGIEFIRGGVRLVE